MQQTWAVFANGTQVRVFWVDGEPLFDAVGVCEAVGLHKVEKALRRLDDDEKDTLIVEGLDGQEEIPVVRETGVLRLALVGKDEYARAIQRWVAHELMPNAMDPKGARLEYEREQLRAQKVGLLVDLLLGFEDRLSDDAVERIVTTVADVMLDKH
ncbi:Bro-N domain-containing protein [Alicyclobacillus mali]|uniref:Bro-N domain-containing protein n=1 Tax=Alicyclobacillus mali (ex Roth et al. 2021) TaxID=1123961 RepID=A0ABS0EZB2_9BACL|nr:Bro-N domain-containing protein [Alicyclobacillus mali (ex Roth et al. 2021)]MBF8376377.1 Bro-N domain-containing protein [Alicyclobacillus mali (ex Roth et al. 2021)]